MELNTIRTFYSTALAKFQRLHAASEDGALTSSQVDADADGDVSMRGPAQASESQRRSLRSALPNPSQIQANTQPGPLTQAAEAGLEQARKIRRF